MNVSGLYAAAGQLVAARAYHTIPASGTGAVGENYDETRYGYDLMGRQNRVVSPGGTITRTVFDADDRTIAVYVGTNDDGASDSAPQSALPNNNLRQTLAQTYAAGCDCSQPNQRTEFVDEDPAHNRVTTFTLDFRNRVVAIDGEIDFYEQRFYDNLDHVVQVDRRNTSAAGNLIARSQSLYDDQGRVYRTLQYAVNSSTGAVGVALSSNTWYDEAGNAIKQLPAGSQRFTKTLFDSQKRPYASYQGFYTAAGDEPYAEVGVVTNQNIIFEQTLTTFDAAGNAIQIASYQRFHDATGNNVLHPSYSGTQPLARVNSVASYFDGIARTLATVQVGTNGNVPFTRPERVPDRSDTTLVNSTEYDAAGQPCQSIDPAGIVTRQTFNALGQPLSTIQNFTGACPGNETDVTVTMQYNADGNLIALTAVNPTTGDQVTRYEYGVTLADSSLASNSLLRATLYPDAVDGADRVTQRYNRQGQVTGLTDQRGTTHSYLYDQLGRQTADAITTLGSGVAGSIRRIGRTYDVRGLTTHVTSYSDVSGTTVANQVQNAYNDFQQLTFEYQSHGGAVNPSTTPSVDYTYADGATNTVRPIAVLYPDGRVVTAQYGTSGSDDDRLSRVGQLVDALAGQTLVQYTYLGLGSFVQSNSPQPSVAWSLITGSGVNPYASLDNFGRVTNCQWMKAATTLEQVQYTYNRSSSRTSRHETLASGNDELYNYDDLQRLIDMARGDLAAGNASINNVSFGQDWQLDATGNWSGFKTLDVSAPTNNLDQQRVSNAANEITAIAERYGAAWATPEYDRAGNMTVIPSPLVPSTSLAATYDAWNRLVSIPGVTYAYDGLNRRITVTSSGVTRHSYYSVNWQVLEERLDASTTPDRQYVWGLRYIDDCVLRDRGSERLYALQDANWNVTALVNASGAVQERYRYSPYGAPTFLNADFTVRAASSFAWDVLYCGYRYDAAQGWHYVRNRYYQPMLGAWVTRDPVSLPEQKNEYWYVSNCPLTRTDDTGAFDPIAVLTSFLPPTKGCVQRSWSLDQVLNAYGGSLTSGASGSIAKLAGVIKSIIPKYNLKAYAQFCKTVDGGGCGFSIRAGLQYSGPLPWSGTIGLASITTEASVEAGGLVKLSDPGLVLTGGDFYFCGGVKAIGNFDLYLAGFYGEAGVKVCWSWRKGWSGAFQWASLVKTKGFFYDSQVSTGGEICLFGSCSVVPLATT